VPQVERRPLTKPLIALELLDRGRAKGLPGWAVVADPGYGVAGDFREGLAARGLTYIVGVTGDFVVFPERRAWTAPRLATGGRPQTRPQLVDGSPRPIALSELAQRVTEE
jgi:SRSO17 transposase